MSAISKSVGRGRKQFGACLYPQGVEMEGANAFRGSLQGDKNSLKFNTGNGFKIL